MFTNYFIKKKIQELVAQAANRPRHSISLNEAQSLLVLYNDEDREAVMAVLEPLRKQVEVHTCVCISSKTSDAIMDDKTVPVYSKHSLNAWGFPSETLLDKVSVIKADILIDVSRPGCCALQYIALKHPCSFKVGIKYQGQEWYDLALSIPDSSDMRYSLEQILHYLRLI